MLCFFYHLFHFFFKRDPDKPKITPEELKKMQEEDNGDWNCWC